MAALKTLLETGIRQAYAGEKASLAPLERAAGRVSDEQLRKVLRGHHKVTQKQIERLEKAFKSLRKPTGGQRDPVSDLLLEDLETAGRKGSAGGDTVDLRVCAAALRIEHFELATYKYLIKLSIRTGPKRVTSQLEKNMGEEESAGQELEKMAEEIAQRSS